MKRAYLLIVPLVALGVGVWLPPVQAFLRDSVIVPMLEILWFLKLVYESIPQAFIWGFLVLVALIAVWRSALLNAPTTAVAIRPSTTGTGLLAPWARLIYQAENDDYARWRLAQRLAQLAQRMLHADSLNDLRRYLASRPAEVPPEVGAYLLAGMATYSPGRRVFPILRLFGFNLREQRSSESLALDPAQVITFLEGRTAGAGSAETQIDGFTDRSVAL